MKIKKKNSNFDYRKEIDGLRALAVIPVIFFHLETDLMPNGFLGVDIFFVISGFLITSLIKNELDNDKFSITSFYTRRARRILPALFLISFICIPISFLVMYPQQLLDFAQSLVSLIFFSSNYLFWWESNYFDLTINEKPLIHTWSLSIEEQFYLLFPIFMITILSKKNRLIICLAVIFLSFNFINLLSLSKYSDIATQPKFEFYMLFTRAWELLFGSIVAFLSEKKFNNLFISILSFVLLICLLLNQSNSEDHIKIKIFLTVLSTSLLILFTNGPNFIKKFLSFNIFTSIGLISYSTYLWHMPIFAFAKIVFFQYTNFYLLSVLLISPFILGFFTWKYIENPFRDYDKINNKLFYTTVIALAIIILIFGLLGHYSKGFPSRLSEKSFSLLETGKSSPKITKCMSSNRNYIEPRDACKYFNDKTKFATFGDSHVNEISYSLAEELQKKNIGISHHSFTGCMPILRNFNDNLSTCQEWVKNTVKFIKENDDIEYVVINFRYSYYLNGEHRNKNKTESRVFKSNLKYSEKKKIIFDSLDFIVSELSNKKKIFIVLPFPELDLDVRKLVFSNDLKNKNINKTYGTNLRKYYKRNSDIMKWFTSKEFPHNFYLIDPKQFLCNETDCFIVNNNKLLYYDDDHLSLNGTNLLAKIILKKIDFYISH